MSSQERNRITSGLEIDMDKILVQVGVSWINIIIT